VLKLSTPCIPSRALGGCGKCILSFYSILVVMRFLTPGPDFHRFEKIIAQE